MITNAVVKIIYVDDFYLSNVIRYNCIIYCELYPTADDDQYAHDFGYFLLCICINYFSRTKHVRENI